jgi:hypothetical protein
MQFLANENFPLLSVRKLRHIGQGNRILVE